MIPDINLIPNLDKDDSGSKILYLILSSVALLLLSLLAWQYFQARADIVTLTNEQTALQAQRDELKSQLDGMNPTTQGSLQQSVDFVELVSYPVTPLIDEIQMLQPNHSYLRSYSFDAESVSITVDFETLNDVAEYISRLTNSAYFSDVQVSSVANFNLGTESSTEGETDFDVIPRQTANFTLVIDESYLATGGVE
ncbi:PilN domain-containing protein [Ureibacillus sp. NPDC094379]